MPGAFWFAVRGSPIWLRFDHHRRQRSAIGDLD
jgi:hypothetical protein